jgi:histidine triad (HIT) family protein
MPLHEPSGYSCPFCNIVAGGEDPTALVWHDELSIAFLSLHQQPRNAGSLLLCPIAHFENIYVLPENLGAHLFKVTKLLALALRTTMICDGVSIRQHNEPAGGQDVWHYHIHIVPRYHNDQHYTTTGEIMPIDQRIEFARRIRAELVERVA